MTVKTIRGAGGGSGGSSHTPVNAPDTLNSKAYARIIDLVSEGEIQGFALGFDNALQCIYLDQTPIANSDGSLNFQYVQVDSRAGTQTQAYMTGFPDVQNEIGVNVELKSGTPFIRQFTDTDLSAIAVRLSVPNGLQSENTSNGDINGYSIAYTIEIQADSGPWVMMVESAFTGKASSNYERSHRIDLPPATTSWNVRVTRTTANANSSTVSDTTTIESVTEIVDGKFSYPNSAIVGTVFDASQFSSIPTRSFHMQGRIIQVPSNYDPVARTYTGAWDGSFKPAYSNNPAWVYWDMATHPRYGLGNQLTAAQVNKWALYAIGQYCDGMVPDGKGGTEPRFTCNIYLQTRADAYKVMSDLASVFRGLSYYMGNAISASSDMPSDPVYTYTTANVVNGLFTYSGSARTTRYTVALVSWNDPSNFYLPATEYVPDQTGIARYGIQQTEVTAVGCTSQGQAQRVGNWLLTTSRLEGETVTFGVGLDGMPCAPGQIVRIADPNRMGRRVAGRISVSTNNSITVDKLPPVINVGDTCTVTLPSGVTESHAISGIAGNVISISGNFSANPVAQSVWLVESTELTAPTFRVLSRKDNGDMTYTITAARNIAGKYDEIDNGTIIQIPPTSVLLPKVQGAPTSVTLIAVQTAGAVVASTVLNISWAAVLNASKYVVEYRYNNGEWTPVPALSGTSVSIPGAMAGDYIARVSAVNAAGNSSAFTTSATYTVIDQSVVPETLAQAQAAASAASTAAAAANAELAQVSSDGVLTPAEKSVVIKDASVIFTEQPGIDTQAAAFSISTEKTAYDNAVSALNTYLGTLTAPTLWNDLTGNTNVVSSTFRSTFANVYTTRQTLLNAIYGAAKAIADQANTTAQNLDMVNLSMAQGLYGWSCSNANDTPNWYAETGTNGPNGGTSTYVVHHTSAYISQLNNTFMPIQGGTVVKVSGQVKGVGSPNGIAGLYVAFYDINRTFISAPNSSYVTGNVQQTLVLTATAPANAAFVTIGPTVGSVASGAQGYYTWANFTWQTSPASVDEVPDGSTYAKTKSSSLTNGVPPPYGSGKNMIGNPTFVSNTMGIAAGTHVAQGGWLCDGWQVQNLSDATLTAQCENGAGSFPGFHPYLSFTGTGTIPTNTNWINFIGALSFGTAPQAQYVLYMQYRVDTNTAPPAGVNRFVRMSVRWFDGTGTYISETAIDNAANFSGTLVTVQGTVTAPANARTGVPYCGAFIQNSSGSGYAISGTAPLDFRVGYMGCYATASLDNEVTDGNTYGRVKQSAMASGTGFPFAGAYTNNCVTNPNFVNNKLGVAGTTITAAGTAAANMVCDDWRLEQNDNNAFSAVRESGGSPNGGGTTDLLIRLVQNQAIGAGAGLGCYVRQTGLVPVNARDRVMISGWTWVAYSAGLPTGCAAVQFIGVDWLDANGNAISSSDCSISRTGSGIISQFFSQSFTPPSNAQNFRIVCGAQIFNNQSGNSAFNTGTNLYADARFNAIRVVIAAQNQADLPQRTVTNFASKVPSSISYSATTTTATITVSAMSVLAGSVTVNYGASSVGVSGTSGSTVVYYLYYNDPNYVGGSPTLVATTNGNDLYTNDGTVFVGSVSVTYPTSGTGGGTSGGGGSQCVTAETWLWVLRGRRELHLQAIDVRAGDYLRVMSPSGGHCRWGRITMTQRAVQPCAEIVTRRGVVLDASLSAPIGIFTGQSPHPMELEGAKLLTNRNGKVQLDRVSKVQRIGRKNVIAITCENDFFLAGKNKFEYLCHHNLKTVP